ncbi:hypothetical protein [Streptomyces plumbiresistens]|uniref:Uncharacterized protein n=1 Tax=Streptomyces plumbiresistens TaxID=511811 RepID=A0ABP7ST10_9ACTN
MSETPVEYSGTGTEADPLTFSTRQSAPDQVGAVIAGLASTTKEYAAGFRANADLSGNLPADIRGIVSDASGAITGTLSTAYNARVKADSFRNDRSLYPEGRKLLAGEVVNAAIDEVTESFEHADAQIEVASALTFEAARPRISPDDAMPARADLAMMLGRHDGNPAGLGDTLKRLAQRSDGVGALVADPSYLGDVLDARGADAALREAILTIVGAEVVKAAAKSGDPKRAAAARTNLALAELRKARIAASSFTRHTLQR